MNRPPSFDDLRCPNAKCERSRKGGEGALSITPGSETDPILLCEACNQRYPWRLALRENLHLTGTSIAGGLFSAALIAIAEAPIAPAARLLFGVGALGTAGTAIWSWARYAGRVVDTKTKLYLSQNTPLGQRPLPPDWISTRDAFLQQLHTIPTAKQSLWPDLILLESKLSDAFVRLTGLQELTNPEAEARLKKELEERAQSMSRNKSQRARELQQEAINLLQQRADELPAQRIREDELSLSLQTATTFLENMRQRLIILRDAQTGQVEAESKLMALDIKGRLAEIESILE